MGSILKRKWSQLQIHSWRCDSKWHQLPRLCYNVSISAEELKLWWSAHQVLHVEKLLKGHKKECMTNWKLGLLIGEIFKLTFSFFMYRYEPLWDPMKFKRFQALPWTARHRRTSSNERQMKSNCNVRTRFSIILLHRHFISRATASFVNEAADAATDGMIIESEACTSMGID